MRVAGIDFSSFAIDVVFVDLDDLTAPEWHRFDLSGQDAFDRTRSIAGVVPSRTSVWWDDVYAVGIEEPTGKFKPGLGYRVQGAVLAMIPAGLMVKPWPPSAWRKAVGLAGNAPKFVVKQHVPPLHYGHTGKRNERDMLRDWPQDACDAYCIALATRSAIERQAA